MKQKTLQYSFEFDQIFDGTDALAALGWPIDDPGLKGLSPTHLSSLIGDGFSAPCISLVQYCYWLNPYAPWWRKLHPDERGFAAGGLAGLENTDGDAPPRAGRVGIDVALGTLLAHSSY